MNFMSDESSGSQLPLWIGTGLAGIGAAIPPLKAVMTAERVSGGLVAAGGIAVVVYGLWSGARERVVRKAREERDKAIEELEKQNVELYRLRAKVAYYEQNHERVSPPRPA